MAYASWPVTIEWDVYGAPLVIDLILASRDSVMSGGSMTNIQAFLGFKQ